MNIRTLTNQELLNLLETEEVMNNDYVKELRKRFIIANDFIKELASEVPQYEFRYPVYEAN